MRGGAADSDMAGKIFCRGAPCRGSPAAPASPSEAAAVPPPPSPRRGLREHVPFMVNGTCSRAGGCRMTTLTVTAPAQSNRLRTLPNRLWALLRSDARHFQIAALATLLGFNFVFLD